MREIKFRAYNEKYKKLYGQGMYRVWEVSIAGDGSLSGNVDETPIAGKQLDHYIPRVYFDEKRKGGGLGTADDDVFFLMQYTGLKDIKNKEIYEGDILKYLNYKGYEEIIEVWWDNDMAGFNFGNRNLSFIKNKLEIIGNIYENPGLLEVEQC